MGTLASLFKSLLNLHTLGSVPVQARSLHESISAMAGAFHNGDTLRARILEQPRVGDCVSVLKAEDWQAKAVPDRNVAKT